MLPLKLSLQGLKKIKEINHIYEETREKVV